MVFLDKQALYKLSVFSLPQNHFEFKNIKETIHFIKIELNYYEYLIILMQSDRFELDFFAQLLHDVIQLATLKMFQGKDGRNEKWVHP